MEIRIAIAAVIIFACVNSLDSSKSEYLSDREFFANLLINILRFFSLTQEICKIRYNIHLQLIGATRPGHIMKETILAQKAGVNYTDVNATVTALRIVLGSLGMERILDDNATFFHK